jgi:hypothetical protein
LTISQVTTAALLKKKEKEAETIFIVDLLKHGAPNESEENARTPLLGFQFAECSLIMLLKRHGLQCETRRTCT